MPAAINFKFQFFNLCMRHNLNISYIKNYLIFKRHIYIYIYILEVLLYITVNVDQFFINHNNENLFFRLFIKKNAQKKSYKKSGTWNTIHPQLKTTRSIMFQQPIHLYHTMMYYSICCYRGKKAFFFSFAEYYFSIFERKHQIKKSIYLFST